MRNELTDFYILYTFHSLHYYINDNNLLIVLIIYTIIKINYCIIMHSHKAFNLFYLVSAAIDCAQ